MELIKLGDKTYYIKNNTNIGVYKINERDVILIDSGIDSEVGRKILKVIRENDMEVVGIINTHSHADHIGGNNFIQSRTNCKIYNLGIENVIVNNPILEPMIMYSVEMAYLYDFVNKDGFDLSHKTTVFKRVKDKSKILEKQKKGIYN